MNDEDKLQNVYIKFINGFYLTRSEKEKLVIFFARHTRFKRDEAFRLVN